MGIGVIVGAGVVLGVDVGTAVGVADGRAVATSNRVAGSGVAGNVCVAEGEIVAVESGKIAKARVDEAAVVGSRAASDPIVGRQPNNPQSTTKTSSPITLFTTIFSRKL